MKVRFLVASLALVLFALAVPARAQSGVIAVKIPYEFTAGNRKLAAGQYLINRPISTDPRVLGFRGDAKHQKALVTTRAKTDEAPATDTELIFARYGDVYYLRSVRVRGARELYEVPISSAERAVAAKAAAVMITLKAEGK